MDMRLLRLDLDHGRSKLDLHPLLSVVHGLTPAQRQELLEVVQGLARGSTAGVRGLIQDQGILVDLDGLAGDRLLPVTGANVIVDCDAAEAAGLAGLQAQIDQLERRAEIDAVVVEEIRADLAPSARAKVAELRSKLAPIDPAAAAAREAENQRVAAALAAVAAQPPSVHEAPEGVLALRQRWDAHAARLADAEQHFAALMNAVKHSETRTAKASQALELARKEAKPALLTRAEESRLEQLSFPEQDDTRRGRWRKTLKPEEEAEKEELLEKVGVESWTAYTVYRVAPSAPPERIEAEAAAERVLEEAEANLTAARAKLNSDELTRSLNEEADAIRADARPFLGQLLPSDLGQALRELVVEKPNLAWIAALQQLRGTLDELSIPVVSPIEGAADAPSSGADSQVGRDVIASAEKWLDRRRREQIDFDRDLVEAELGTAQRELDRHEQALRRIERAEAAASSSAARLAQLQELLAARSSGGEAAIESVLMLVGPVAGQVEVEAEGSLPIVISGSFGSLDDRQVPSLLEQLRSLSERLQILVLSEHPAILAWAEEAGLEQALVTKPKPLPHPASRIDS